MDSLALRLLFGFHPWKALVGSQRAGRERDVDMYPSDSAFLPTRPREARDDITCDFIQLLPSELPFSILKPMHSEEKQLTFGSSFELENSL